MGLPGLCKTLSKQEFLLYTTYYPPLCFALASSGPTITPFGKVGMGVGGGGGDVGGITWREGMPLQERRAPVTQNNQE